MYDGGDAAKEAAADKSLASTAADYEKLDVQFIGPNAHELAFKALHPEASASTAAAAAAAASSSAAAGDEKNKKGGQSDAARAVKAAAERLDPTDPAVVEAAKKVLAVEFIGPNSDELTFKALFPDRAPPTTPKVAHVSEDGEDKGKQRRVGDGAGGGGGGQEVSTRKTEPLEYITGAAGLEVQFIGPNAAELTLRAMHPDETNAADAAAAAAAEAAAATEAAIHSQPPPNLLFKPLTPPRVRAASEHVAWTTAEAASRGSAAGPSLFTQHVFAQLKAQLRQIRALFGQLLVVRGL